MNYHTFNVLITGSGTANHYQIFALSTSQGEAYATTTIDPKSPPLAELLMKLEGQCLSDKELKLLGTELYQCLFIGDNRVLFNRSMGETLARDDIGLRLNLIIEVPELNVLPWELLYSSDQHLFLAASVETPLSRYLSIPTPIRSMAAPKQLQILTVIPGSSGLNTEPEKQILRAVEAKLKPKIKVDFMNGPATPEAIRSALRNNEYHILHYAGHGLFEDEQGFMLLDYDEDSSERMTAERFAHYFLDYPSMRLVFLNACPGATRSAHEVLVGMAPQLVLRGVPAVIAMQDSIRDDDAVLFATEFYAELCHERQGGQVEVAVSCARKALLQSGSQSNGFALPVLYLRAPDGRLWDVEGPGKIDEPEQEPKRKSLFERWQVWVGIVGGILGIILAITELSEKFENIHNRLFSNKEDSTRTETRVVRQTLSGQIVNGNGDPLPGVIVFLPEYDLTDTTNEWGKYYFKLEAPAHALVKLQAKKTWLRNDQSGSFIERQA